MNRRGKRLLRSPAHGIGVIFYLPALSGYHDRAHLLGQVAAGVDRATLVTARCDRNPSDIGLGASLEVIEVPPGRSLPGRTAWAASGVVQRLVQTGEYNVVHDTFGHLLPLMLRRQVASRVMLISSQYSFAEWDFRQFLWPRYRFGALRYSDLRLWMARIAWQRAVFGLVDCVVWQAPGLVDRFVEMFPTEGAYAAWLPNSVEGVQARRPCRRDDGKIRLLVVGALFVGKGADILLDLLCCAKTEGVDLHASVIGGVAAVDRTYLESRIRQLDLKAQLNIEARRPREAVEEYYQSSDWLFHVTSVDGSPRVVLEALARGLPVVGSNHPGIRVLDPDGQFILFADNLKSECLLGKLVAAQKSPRAHKERSRRGQEYVGAHFTSRVVSASYVELYRRLLAGSVDMA